VVCFCDGIVASSGETGEEEMKGEKEGIGNGREFGKTGYRLDPPWHVGLSFPWDSSQPSLPLLGLGVRHACCFETLIQPKLARAFRACRPVIAT